MIVTMEVENEPGDEHKYPNCGSPKKDVEVPKKQEVGSQRQSTVDAILARAKSLYGFADHSRRQAQQLTELAYALQMLPDDDWQPGSEADEALYKLVVDCPLEKIPGS